MNKLLKTLGAIVGVFLVILVLALTALAMLVSPNKLKPLISTQVLQYTGRQLVIDGDISWTIFPYLAVKIGHASLSNPASFKEKTFAEFDHATVGVKLLPLLHRSIESNGIRLSGFKIHLIKNADGQSNWEIMQQAKPETKPSPTLPVTTENHQVVMIDFQIPIIKVNDATVTWTDQKTGHYVQIDKYNFEATDITPGHSFPITSSMDFTSKSPEASGHINMKGDVTLNTGSETLSKIQQVSFTGTLTIDDLRAGKLKMTNVSVDALLKDGVLKFAPIKADFYQGKLQGESTVDLNTDGPDISLQMKLANVQINPIIQDLQKSPSKYQLKGAANISFQVTTNGNAPLPALNGTAAFSLDNSVLDGVNVGYLIDSAVAMIRGQKAPAPGENLTNLGTLNGTATIKNGVIENQDLVITSPRFNTTGQGTIDLVRQQIAYHFNAKPTIMNLVIPVNINGDLDSPSIQVDKNAILGTIAKEQLKGVGKDITDVIKIPGQAGSLLKGLLGR